MRGLAQAEWLRFRKRRVLLLIVVAVPLLAGCFFIGGYVTTGQWVVSFDPEEVRARIIAEGWFSGLPPDEVEAAIAQEIESQRAGHELALEQLRIERSRYAFPHSVVMLLSNGMYVLAALVLLTALSIGDEFGWGTIRTALLASSHRVRQLLVRFGALALAAVAMLALLVLLGTILPSVLVLAGTILPGVFGLAGAPLPSSPEVDAGGVAALLGAQLLIALMVIAFAALVTLIIRSGSLTLVAGLVYILVETAVIGLLGNLKEFQPQGANEWLLEAFPIRAIAAVSDLALRATGGLPSYGGEVTKPDLGAALVPGVALVLWAGLFASLAFRRFSQMDIRE